MHKDVLQKDCNVDDHHRGKFEVFFFLSSLFSTPWKRSGNARTFRDFMGSRRAERGFSVDVAACVRNKDKKCAFNWCSPSPLRQIQRERKQTTMEIKWKNERGWLHASSSWWLSCWKRIRRSQAFQLEFLLEMLKASSFLHDMSINVQPSPCTDASRDAQLEKKSNGSDMLQARTNPVVIRSQASKCSQPTPTLCP